MSDDRNMLDMLPGYALRRAANAMMADLGERLSPLGLRVSDITVMKLVDERKGATSSQISRALDINRTNMVPVLKRLEEAGLARREAINGKSQAIVLTSKGQSTLAKAWQVIEQLEGDLIARIPAQHRPHFLPALQALYQSD